MENNMKKGPAPQECCEEQIPFLQELDHSLQYEIEVYSRLLVRINEKLDKFKNREEGKLGSDKDSKCSSEHYFALKEKTRTFAGLNVALENTFDRLNEIL
jgi:predicted RNase H-like nuclease (RuvC/YqgF family)